MTKADLSEVAIRLMKAGKAIGRAATDDTIFRAVVDAYRAVDSESFQMLLRKLEITEDCELICSWLRSKECMLDCIELCGPPKRPITVEDIPKFAEVLVKITQDEELVEILADSIREHDAALYKELVKKLEIERFCHLLCSWACAVRHRLICRVVCSPRSISRTQFVDELARAGAAIEQLVKKRDQLQKVITAAFAFDCEIVKNNLLDLHNCELICEWICSWRCILVCMSFCEKSPVPVYKSPIEEMRSFALISARLAESKDAFELLLATLPKKDTETFAALVKEFKAVEYCHQLCHWLCYELCRWFCICICPKPETLPLFTHVGKYHVDPSDFNADGTTKAEGFAFTGTVDLIGIIPDGSAADAFEYRFTCQKLGGANPVIPITGAMVPPTVIGQLEYWYWDAPHSQWKYTSVDYYVNNPGATVYIKQQSGPDLAVGINTNTDADGWIQIPRIDNFVKGGEGRFIPGVGGKGALIRLDTTTLTKEVFDLTAMPSPISAGDAMDPAKKSEKPIFRINFEYRKVPTVSNPNPPVSGNSLDNIALSNTNYTYTRHPDWAGATVTLPWVLSIDILEMKTGGGCITLAGDIHALFTAYHPYLTPNSCVLLLQGPHGLTNVLTPPVAPDGESNSGTSGKVITLPSEPCAYILYLEATLNLTDGFYQLYDTPDDHIAFCINAGKISPIASCNTEAKITPKKK
jgi:hypothetical protein